MNQSFWEIYNAAGTAQASDSAAILGRLTDLPGVYIGTDGRGALAVVVECEPPAHALAVFELAGVRARFDVLLDLEVDGATRQARCSLLQCLVADRSVQKLFLSTAESLLGESSAPRTTESVYDQFQTVVWMFSRLGAPAVSSVTGLVGELAVLAFHPTPAAAAYAWRVKNNSRFDFTFGEYRLEVKSTTTRTRSHAVSYEQVNPPAGAAAYLASVWVEETHHGISGADLLESAVTACGGDDAAAQRVRDVVTSTMGSGLQAFLDFRCDEAVLRGEMRFYDAHDVPAFRHLPGGVSGAAFTSDFAFADSVRLPSSA